MFSAELKKIYSSQMFNIYNRYIYIFVVVLLECFLLRRGDNVLSFVSVSLRNTPDSG